MDSLRNIGSNLSGIGGLGNNPFQAGGLNGMPGVGSLVESLGITPGADTSGHCDCSSGAGCCEGGHGGCCCQCSQSQEELGF